jgi:hypothetical protein
LLDPKVSGLNNNSNSTILTYQGKTMVEMELGILGAYHRTAYPSKAGSL